MTDDDIEDVYFNGESIQLTIETGTDLLYLRHEDLCYLAELFGCIVVEAT